MKPLTLEWIEKAEEDWVMMLRGYRARKDPAYNAACFHAQQCAEKYLKGRLEEAGIAFAKTHDLIELLDQVRAVEPGWSILQPGLEGSPLAQAVKIGRQLNLMIPMDLLVRTREQVAMRLAMDDFFMREILERGKVMYEAHHGYSTINNGVAEPPPAVTFNKADAESRTPAPSTSSPHHV